MIKKQETMTDDQAASMESRLNTDTEALVSSVLSNNEDIDLLLGQLKLFIQKKDADISAMCGEHSQSFSQSIEGAQKLGKNASDLQSIVQQQSQRIDMTIEQYEQTLSEAVGKRQEISKIDTQLAAVSEFMVIMQLLQNINEEIANGNLYVAIVRILEFADYDSHISSCTVIHGLQQDIESIINNIEKAAENKVSEWLTDFMPVCHPIGSAYLFGTPEVKFNLSPLYEYYMIKKQLGKLDSLEHFYFYRRSRQIQKLLAEAITPPSGREQTESNRPHQYSANDTMYERTKKILCVIGGFFLTEARISSDGFNLIPQQKLDEIWKKAIMSVQNFLSDTNVRYEDYDATINETIQLSHLINLFSDKMSGCSLSCQELKNFLDQKSPIIKKFIIKKATSLLDNSFNNNTQDLMVVKTPEEFTNVAKYGLADTPHEFPTEMKFLPTIIDACKLIETYLEKWADFGAKNNEKTFIDLFETLVIYVYTAMRKIVLDSQQIPTISFIIATTLAFQKTLPYFDSFIQKTVQSTMKPDYDKIKKSANESLDQMLKQLKNLYAENLINQIIDTHIVKEMQSGTPPHMFSSDVVRMLETMVTIMQPIFPHVMFQNVIEFLAKYLSDRISNIIATTKIPWTPDLISATSQNVTFISTWSTLIAIPSAKAQMNGLIKMLNLLLSNQLVTQTSDPQFTNKNKDINYDAMVNIMKNYKPNTTKTLYVIPNTVLSSLISKFQPLCKIAPPQNTKH